MRSIAAASRAAERDAERRRKYRAKADMTSAASDAVDEWQQIMSDLVSIHSDRADLINWQAIADSQKPLPPVQSNARELAARTQLEAFRPSKLDFLSGGTAKRRQKLIDLIEPSIAEDSRVFREAEQQFHATLADWVADTDLARRLLAGEAAAIRDVIAEMQSLSKEQLIGTDINFLISDSSIHAVVRIHNDEIVPGVRRKQLASGKLSETKMPTGDFNELYQDYVCSTALRVGGDLLSLIPLDEIYVTCTPMLLDRSSGHQRHTSILSVQIVRDSFNRLKLVGIDPSDAMKNFNHTMDFKRARGFAEIQPLRSTGDA